MKKGLKGIFYLIMLGVMMYAPSAMAMTCKFNGSNLEVTSGDKTILIDSQIPHTVHMIIVILKIAIPILLVILGMLDLLKGVTAQKEEEIKKGQQIFVKRLIAAVIVFFVITIVQLVVSFADSNKNDNVMDCANCFINNKCGEK